MMQGNCHTGIVNDPVVSRFHHKSARQLAADRVIAIDLAHENHRAAARTAQRMNLFH
jgi:hypothetical protein